MKLSGVRSYLAKRWLQEPALANFCVRQVKSEVRGQLRRKAMLVFCSWIKLVWPVGFEHFT